MLITWHGHSCFSVKSAGGVVVFDPYSDGYVPGYAPLRLRADAVYCSHDHKDHNAAETVAVSGEKFGGSMESIACWHDGDRGRKRGRNTIRILTDEGLRAAHLGDLGHIPEKDQIEKLRGVDALMIPVGGFYTIDPKQAKQIIDLVEPRVVIPCHYREENMGYDVLAELTEFTGLCDNVVRYRENSFILTADTVPQTAVLTYKGAVAK